MYADRIPPHDEQAENSVIGSLLLDGEAISKVSGFLKSSDFFAEKKKYLNNKDYQDIKIGQKAALKEVLKKKKNPFREIIIKKFNEDTLGKLFLSFIVETIILGKYMKVNPYDQPAVEEVKVLTRKFLI